MRSQPRVFEEIAAEPIGCLAMRISPGRTPARKPFRRSGVESSCGPQCLVPMGCHRWRHPPAGVRSSKFEAGFPPGGAQHEQVDGQ
ncbi:hypothetical protein BKA01_002994 [Pseudonocardia eucalypti]|nr:hypothetical protein [Pseudonocardia eucalypti]